MFNADDARKFFVEANKTDVDEIINKIEAEIRGYASAGYSRAEFNVNNFIPDVCRFYYGKFVGYKGNSYDIFENVISVLKTNGYNASLNKEYLVVDWL